VQIFRVVRIAQGFARFDGIVISALGRTIWVWAPKAAFTESSGNKVMHYRLTFLVMTRFGRACRALARRPRRQQQTKGKVSVVLARAVSFAGKGGTALLPQKVEGGPCSSCPGWAAAFTGPTIFCERGRAPVSTVAIEAFHKQCSVHDCKCPNWIQKRNGGNVTFTTCK